MATMLYDMVQTARRMAHQSHSPTDMGIPNEDVLRYVLDGEHFAIAKLGRPRVQSFIPLSATNTSSEFRIGGETWLATQDDSDLDVEEDGTKDENQRWTWNKTVPPVMGENIIEVLYRPSSTSAYVPLHRYTLEELSRMGWDWTHDANNSRNTQSPMGWYTRHDYNEVASGKSSLILGIFPPPVGDASDNEAVKVIYLPSSLFKPIVWGTHWPYEGYAGTSVSGLKVVPCQGKATVFFEGMHSNGGYQTAEDTKTIIDAGTYSCPVQGVEAGLMFAVVRGQESLPRQWYRITSVKKFSDLVGYDSSYNAYANYVIGFDIAPVFAQLSGNAASEPLNGNYVSAMNFVISSDTMVGVTYTNPVIQMITTYAATQILLSIGRYDEVEFMERRLQKLTWEATLAI